MSWTLAWWNWLAAPVRKRRERRNAKLAAECIELAETFKAVGFDDTARVLQKHAEGLATSESLVPARAPRAQKERTG